MKNIVPLAFLSLLTFCSPKTEEDVIPSSKKIISITDILPTAISMMAGLRGQQIIIEDTITGVRGAFKIIETSSMLPQQYSGL